MFIAKYAVFLKVRISIWKICAEHCIKLIVQCKALYCNCSVTVQHSTVLSKLYVTVLIKLYIAQINEGERSLIDRILVNRPGVSGAVLKHLGN